MKKFIPPLITVAIIALLVIINGSLFVIDQRSTALVVQFGKIVREIKTPGLYFKWPLIQRVIAFEYRMLTLDDSEPTRVTTQEKSDLLVDLFIKWRIVEPSPFYTQLRSINGAQSRISQVINARLREEFGRRSMSEVVSGQRDDVMLSLRKDTSSDLKPFGIEIVDVRLKGVELPPNVLESAFERMRAERLRVANERRSTGAADSERIRAEADKQRQIITATAFKEAEILRGEGDAKAAVLYNKAFQVDPDFYSFYKGLQTYQKSFGNEGDLWVLDPHSKFFRHFNR